MSRQGSEPDWNMHGVVKFNFAHLFMISDACQSVTLTIEPEMLLLYLSLWNGEGVSFRSVPERYSIFLEWEVGNWYMEGVWTGYSFNSDILGLG